MTYEGNLKIFNPTKMQKKHIKRHFLQQNPYRHSSA